MKGKLLIPIITPTLIQPGFSTLAGGALASSPKLKLLVTLNPNIPAPQFLLQG